MGKELPCRKCPKCGQINNLYAEDCCKCGSYIKNVPIVVIDDEEINDDLGVDLTNPPVLYYQKCRKCSAENFTCENEAPISRCLKCNSIDLLDRKRFASKGTTPSSEPAEGINHFNLGSTVDNQGDGDQGSEAPVSIDETGESNTQFYISLLKSSLQNSQTEGNRASLGAPEKDASETFDDDAADSGSWDSLGLNNEVGTNNAPRAVSVQTRKEHGVLQLTAVTYGIYSFKITAAEGLCYMLGREANEKEFLENDLRVGRNHCQICYRNGGWIVKDNHSSNGTAVNYRDIGEDGELELKNGDILVLGHETDSMAFKVMIQE